MGVSDLAIVSQPHPLLPAADRRVWAQDWRPGETARAVLLRAGLDPHCEIHVLINDRVLTREEWDSVCPSPGDLVHAVAAVSGGSGGSNPLRTVLMIAVMVASFFVGPEIGAYLGGFDSVGAMTAAGSIGALGLSGAAWGAIGSGLVSLAGNLVVGALFKPSTGALSQVNGSSAAASPTYSLSGGSNSLRPYSPMQVVCGTHRVFPDYGAKPYTEFQGADQYLFQIFHFGLSTVQLTDLRIGDSSIGNYADVSLYWSDDSGALPQFPGNVDSDSGATLVRGADWIVRTTAQETVRFAIDTEGSIYYASDKGALPCWVRLEAQYAPSGTGAWQAMLLGEEVTYTTGYWSLQTTEVVWEQTQVSDPSTPWRDSFVSEGWVRRVVQHAYTHVASAHYEGETQQIGSEQTFAGLVPVYATWHWAPFYSDAAVGGTTPTGLANDGPQAIHTPVAYVDIAHGASQTPQRRTFSLDVPQGVYDVRVRLTSARALSAEIQDGDDHGAYRYSWTTLRSYQPDDASYAGQTRLGMIIRASGQLSGVVQRLSALASAYAWCYVSGAWRWQPTSNPAWWYLDFARGRKNALGAQSYGCHLDESQIDTAGILAWAAFCDVEGLSCNLVIDSPQSAWDTLSDIARCGLGSPSWSSGKLGVVWDRRNASPVAAFGMSNILRGSFNVRYVTENLAEEIVVSYVDADRDWTQQQVRVTVPGVSNPQRASTIEIKGCTNSRLAGKLANIQASAQAYRRRTITWDTDMEGFVCQRGDVVLLQHDLTQWGYSGRLLAVAGAVVTLDRKVPRAGGTDYVMLAFPDGSMATFTALPPSGRTNLLIRSEQFGHTQWTKVRASITADSATAPDGSLTADKLVEDATASSTHECYSFLGKSGSPVTYTFSVYAKAAERSQILLLLDSTIGGNSARCQFDLAAGTAGTPFTQGAFSGTTASITAAGNGWYRCAITSTTDADTRIYYEVFLVVAGSYAYTGNGASGAYLWGAQLEAGALTAYIPTVATPVTVYDDSSSLTLNSAPTLQGGMLEIDHRWFFSPLPTPGKRVKIVSVKPLSQYRLQIVATDDDPDLYAAWDGSWTPPANNTLLRASAPTIREMAVSESLVLTSPGVVSNRVVLSFSVDGALDAIFLRYRVASGPRYSRRIEGTSLSFDTDETGPLEVEANAISGLSLGGRYNGRGLIVGKSAVPRDVTGFSLAASGAFASLTCDATDELDVRFGGRLLIRQSSLQSGATWNNSAYLTDAVPGSPVLVPLLAGTYLAKWVDSGGRESRNEALILSTVTSALQDLNFVATLDDGGTWPGTKSSVVLDPTMGGIKLDSAQLIDAIGTTIDDWAPLDTLGGNVVDGVYTLAANLDLGRVLTSRLTGALDLLAFSATDLIDTWGLIDSRTDTDGGGDPVDGRLDKIDTWLDLDGISLSAARAFFEISTSPDLANWSAWQVFQAGEWTFRGIRARLRLQADLAYINVVVRGASLTVDMPDRTEAGNDLVASGGTRSIAYANPFQVSPALAIAAQGMGTGDYYEITGKSANGFTISFKNASGTLVTRSFDYISKGY